MDSKIQTKLKDRFNLIKNFYISHSRMPSYSEMSFLFGVKSKNAVFKIVNRLIELNLLKKDEKGYLSFSSNPFSIKLLGYVEAGFPSPAEEELMDTLSLDRFLVDNPESTFMLKVSGDSMIEAGILPGDYVIVDRAKTPNEHDIVIAQVDGKWTMKYLIRDKSRNRNSDMNNISHNRGNDNNVSSSNNNYRSSNINNNTDEQIKKNINLLQQNTDGETDYILLPANSKYKPIRPKNELVIAGVVVGVARKYK